MCKVYNYRPLGCRIYSVIYVECEGPSVDEECPLSHTLTTNQLIKGMKLINEFIKKIEKEYGYSVCKSVY